MSGWHSFWAACALACAVLAYQGDVSDLPPGPYCGLPRTGCCNGRIDSCSAPILGTLCYCDDFCNRTRSEDCCPDYWSFCHGVQPPAELIRGE
jgi:Somatomedin B domain